MQHIIVEGVDRLGKGTLIKGLQDVFGFFQVIHYQKPLLLECYKKVDDPLLEYQRRSFIHMFDMLVQKSVPCIMDRAHLGEAVYAHRYRGYDGNYVFDIEESFIKYIDSDVCKNTLLILLTTSDFSFIQDDGLSFDFAKKEEEQEDFKKAFFRSKLERKLLVDVSDGDGGFRSPKEILIEVVRAVNTPFEVTDA